jgi:hypothetical protein
MMRFEGSIAGGLPTAGREYVKEALHHGRTPLIDHFARLHLHFRGGNRSPHQHSRPLGSAVEKRGLEIDESRE